MCVYLVNTGVLCCRFVTHARGLQTARVPPAPSRGPERSVWNSWGCREGVRGRGYTEEGVVDQPSASCQTDKWGCVDDMDNKERCRGTLPVWTGCLDTNECGWYVWRSEKGGLLQQIQRQWLLTHTHTHKVQFELRSDSLVWKIQHREDVKR